MKAFIDLAVVAIIVICLGIFALGIGFSPVMDILVRGVELL